LATKELRRLLTSLARYVNSASGIDLNKALTSGFQEAKGHEPIVHLDAPTGLTASTGKQEGSVALRFKGVRGARMYQVYMSTADAPDKWLAVVAITRTKHVVTGLESQKSVNFRVTSMGAAGESVPSDITKAKAA
jgi:hypothetical protein